MRTDFRCGPAFGADCDASDPGGPCCSDHGWCGKTDDHCKCENCFDFRRKIITAPQGWCVKDRNVDQNDGQLRIGSHISKEVCLQRCYQYEKAYGCEWHVKGSCSVHKQNVVGGNGNKNYKCWVFQRQGILTTLSVFSNSVFIHNS